MAFPPAVRYRMARLKALSRPLRRPAVWGTLAALGLVTAVVPQYLRHPEWRSQYDTAVEGPAPGAGPQLGDLSRDDLADLAEIDNLALLLNQLQPLTATALEAPAAGPQAPAPDRLALPTASPTQPSVSPFAQYLERSQFRFSPAPSGASEADQPTGVPGQRQPFSPTSEALPPSPLQQALSQRLSSQIEPPSTPAAGGGTPGEPDPGGLVPAPWMVEGGLPGVNQRFIRTTPQMSPPPGTTGYTPPPGLAPSPVPVAPAAGAAAPAALDLNFEAPVVTPGSPGQGRSQPVAIDSGLATPPPPTQPEPAPFSAPRPPGVYTGNGYINTFANPSGPVD